MELSADTFNRLSKLQELSKEDVNKILESVGPRLSNASNNDTSLNIPENKQNLGKNVLPGLCCLFTESARQDLKEENLENFLRTSNLDDDRRKNITQAYMVNKENIQSQLATIGCNPPHIVNVDWRLDYCVKYNTSNSTGFPMYHIRLTTKTENSAEQFIHFTCTIHQLQELVLKLKDTARHMEKLTNI